MSMSGRTRAVLIEVTADAYTHDQLDVLFLRLGVDTDPQISQVAGRTKLSRVRRAVELLEEDDRTVELARELVEARFADSPFRLRDGIESPTRPACRGAANRWV